MFVHRLPDRPEGAPPVTAYAEPVVITEPGVHDGMPEAVYHADPVPGGSLSNSGAKLLLSPGCPAAYRWAADHGQPHKDVFDLGHAAHTLVLGAGAPFRVVAAKDWKTKAAQDDRKAAYAAGETPLLTHEHEQVLGMAAALRQHPLAAALLDPATGPAEQSLFWTDPEFGVWRRSRLDKIHYGARTTVVDYKSCISADPEACSKAMHNYGYNRQGPYYVDGAQALGLGGDDTAFLLIFQEKTPPYLIAVAGPDDIALAAGRDLNRRALQLFAECQSTGVWPGYAPDDDLISLPLPPYAERRYLEDHR